MIPARKRQRTVASFLSRDGRVQRIHAGLEGQAAGARHTRRQAELDEYVQELPGGGKDEN